MAQHAHLVAAGLPVKLGSLASAVRISLRTSARARAAVIQATTAPKLFLSLATAQGAAATADCYVFGEAADQA